MKLWQGILLGVFFGLISAALGFTLLSAPRGEAILLEEAPTPAPFLVQVGGAVQNPGVYTLWQGSRLADAVEAAGGLTDDAAASELNLAANLKDGQQVYIPQAGSAGDTRAAGAIDPAAGKINLNTASVAILEELPGIGSSKAEAIVAYRDANGWFTAIEDLENVPGIGAGIFEQIKELVTVGP